MIVSVRLTASRLPLRILIASDDCQQATMPAIGARMPAVSQVGVAPGDDGAMAAMHDYCTAFSGVLAEIQQFLADNGLDDPAKV